MKKRRYKLYEFQAGIYPISIWIYIGADVSGLEDHFNNEAGFEDFDRADSAACTIDVPVGGFKYHNGQGYIIRFHSISDMIMLYVTHEVIHVACKTWEFLGDDPKTGEAFAYFGGWVAGLCEAVRAGREDVKRFEVREVYKDEIEKDGKE